MLAIEYTKVLSEYFELHHMESTTSHEMLQDSRYFSFHLPDHSVVKPESKSTKARVVFNASRKTTSGISLNDVLHIGPSLQNEIIDVVLQWRFFLMGTFRKCIAKYPFTKQTDNFKKLYIEIHRDQYKIICLNTVTFGVNCAPYLAIRTLLQLSEDYKTTHPTAAAILKNHIYVNDVLSGSHSLEGAKKSLMELIDLLSSGGFPLKKITANHHELLENLAKKIF